MAKAARTGVDCCDRRDGRVYGGGMLWGGGQGGASGTGAHDAVRRHVKPAQGVS